MYKLTKLDGKDFYSGTVDYAGSIGKVIEIADYDPPERGACGKGIHLCLNPNDCFIGARIPCRAFRCDGVGEIANDKTKWRFQAVKVIEEIFDLDELFGWNYTEAINPIHPFKIPTPKITQKEIDLLKKWTSVMASVGDSVQTSVMASVGDSVQTSVRASARASVWASVRASVQTSVGDSVWDLVWASVGNSVWDSVRDSVWDSVWASVRASVQTSVGDSVGNLVWDSVGDSVGNLVWDSVRDSVWASVRAYIGSFFQIEKWQYIDHEPWKYPFQAAVDLWKIGLVPSFDGNTWRLHGGPDGKIMFEMRG